MDNKALKDFLAAIDPRGREILRRLMRADQSERDAFAEALMRLDAPSSKDLAALIDSATLNPDPEAFRLQILPGLQRATLPQMMKATGLTSGYCWRIRRGERVPHPMYWRPLKRLAVSSTSKNERA